MEPAPRENWYFRRGLDDYAIETMKSLLGVKIFGTPEFGDEALFYLCTWQNSVGASELVFQAFRGRERIMDAWFPLDFYRGLEQEVVKEFGLGWDRGKWMTVNRAGIGTGE